MARKKSMRERKVSFNDKVTTMEFYSERIEPEYFSKKTREKLMSMTCHAKVSSSDSDQINIFKKTHNKNAESGKRLEENNKVNNVASLDFIDQMLGIKKETKINADKQSEKFIVINNKGKNDGDNNQNENPNILSNLFTEKKDAMKLKNDDSKTIIKEFDVDTNIFFEKTCDVNKENDGFTNYIKDLNNNYANDYDSFLANINEANDKFKQNEDEQKSKDKGVGLQITNNKQNINNTNKNNNCNNTNKRINLQSKKEGKNELLVNTDNKKMEYLCTKNYSGKFNIKELMEWEKQKEENERARTKSVLANEEKTHNNIKMDKVTKDLKQNKNSIQHIYKSQSIFNTKKTCDVYNKLNKVDCTTDEANYKKKTEAQNCNNYSFVISPENVKPKINDNYCGENSNTKNINQENTKEDLLTTMDLRKMINQATSVKDFFEVENVKFYDNFLTFNQKRRTMFTTQKIDQETKIYNDFFGKAYENHLTSFINFFTSNNAILDKEIKDNESKNVLIGININELKNICRKKAELYFKTCEYDRCKNLVNVLSENKQKFFNCLGINNNDETLCELLNKIKNNGLSEDLIKKQLYKKKSSYCELKNEQNLHKNNEIKSLKTKIAEISVQRDFSTERKYVEDFLNFTEVNGQKLKKYFNLKNSRNLFNFFSENLEDRKRVSKERQEQIMDAKRKFFNLKSFLNDKKRLFKPTLLDDLEQARLRNKIYKGIYKIKVSFTGNNVNSDIDIDRFVLGKLMSNQEIFLMYEAENFENFLSRIKAEYNINNNKEGLNDIKNIKEAKLFNNIWEEGYKASKNYKFARVYTHDNYLGYQIFLHLKLLDFAIQIGNQQTIMFSNNMEINFLSKKYINFKYFIQEIILITLMLKECREFDIVIDANFSIKFMNKMIKNEDGLLNFFEGDQLKFKRMYKPELVRNFFNNLLL